MKTLPALMQMFCVIYTKIKTVHFQKELVWVGSRASSFVLLNGLPGKRPRLNTLFVFLHSQSSTNSNLFFFFSRR